MGEIKWVKMWIDILGHKKMKLIRSMPEGDSLALIWIFLILQAGESNRDGAVYFTENMPYNADMFAQIHDFNKNTVTLAFTTFRSLEMIDIYDDVIYVRNWEKYQNIDSMAKVREQTRKRVAKHRENQKNATIEDKSVTCNVTRNATVTGGNATEERSKKKEERNKNIKDVCPEPDKSAPDPSGILLPLNDNSFYDVPLSLIDQWKAAYPAVIVEQELKKMIAWLNSNETRRKTRRGIKTFINNWLCREQDKGRRPATQPVVNKNKFKNFEERGTDLDALLERKWQHGDT